MNNKYQEALDNIVRVSCPKGKSCGECDNRKICNCEAKSYIDTLQELVDLFEEKFVLCPKGWKGCRYTRYYCPNCKKPVKNDDSHCHNCGQNIKFPKLVLKDNEIFLDWSEENE